VGVIPVAGLPATNACRFSDLFCQQSCKSAKELLSIIETVAAYFESISGLGTAWIRIGIKIFSLEKDI
jgi:hypothetical protein